MGTFVPNTKAQQNEMLREIGFEKPDDLFEHIPAEVKFEEILIFLTECPRWKLPGS